MSQACLITFAGPLLQAAAQLIRHFPVFRDVVVSVARKTDAQMWPALFAAVGSPGALLEALLDVGALQSAACCLLIVDRIQGQHEAHGLALRLIQVCCCHHTPHTALALKKSSSLGVQGGYATVQLSLPGLLQSCSLHRDHQRLAHTPGRACGYQKSVQFDCPLP